MYNRHTYKIVFIRLGLIFSLLSLTAPTPVWAQQPDELRTAIRKGCLFLTHLQQESGAIRDTNNSLFSSWETIVATRALFEAKKDLHDSAIAKAILYLKKNENKEGLICHNENCQESYCIETSSEYGMLLAQTSTDSLLTERFYKLTLLQTPQGYWEIGNPDVYEQTKFPSVTAYALNASYELSLDVRFKEEAFLFLEKTQLNDGSWGRHWEYYDTPAYALWQCMKALSTEKKYAQTLKKAKSFVLSTQQEDGSWSFKDTAYTRSISTELHTVLMATCLLDEKDAISKKALSRAIRFLMQRQRPDGSWPGGYFPIKHPRYIKEEYVFATAQTIRLFENYLQRHQ